MGPPFDALEMNAPDRAVLRLTQFSHGGGCGCKIAPAVLQEIIAKTVPGIVPKELLVGIETADDAAVYRINETQAIVATTDFFMRGARRSAPRPAFQLRAGTRSIRSSRSTAWWRSGPSIRTI